MYDPESLDTLFHELESRLSTASRESRFIDVVQIAHALVRLKEWRAEGQSGDLPDEVIGIPDLELEQFLHPMPIEAILVQVNNEIDRGQFVEAESRLNVLQDMVTDKTEKRILADTQGRLHEKRRAALEDALQMARQQDGDLDEQRSRWHAVTQIDPDDVEANDALRQLFSQREARDVPSQIDAIRKRLPEINKDITKVEHARRTVQSLYYDSSIQDPVARDELAELLADLDEARADIQRVSAGATSAENAGEIEKAFDIYRNAMMDGYEVIKDDESGESLHVEEALQRATRQFFAVQVDRSQSRYAEAEAALAEGRPEIAVKRLDEALTLLQRVTNSAGSEWRQKIEGLLENADQQVVDKNEAQKLIDKAKQTHDPHLARSLLLRAKERYPIYPNIRDHIASVEHQIGIAAVNELRILLARAKALMSVRDYGQARQVCEDALRMGQELEYVAQDEKYTELHNQAEALLDEIGSHENQWRQASEKIEAIHAALASDSIVFADRLLEDLRSEIGDDPALIALESKLEQMKAEVKAGATLEEIKPLEDFGEGFQHAMSKAIQGSDLVTSKAQDTGIVDEQTQQNMVRIVWNQIVRVIDEDPRNRPLNGKHTLDIHIMPSAGTQVAERFGLVASRDSDRIYQVLLRFTEEHSNGTTLQPVYFQGTLLLDRLGRSRKGKVFGARLFFALFNGEQPDNRELFFKKEPGMLSLEKGYHRALARTERTGHLRIQLRIENNAPELHNLRWEYLWDEGPDARLACNDYTPFSRVLHVDGPIVEGHAQVGAENRLRVLVAMASPPDWPELKSFNEKLLRNLVGRLNRFQHVIEPIDRGSDNLLSSAEEVVSLTSLNRRFLESRVGRPIHVLHIMCHSLLEEGDSKGYLVFQDEIAGNAKYISEEDFAGMLREYVRDGLRLVVLISCHTATQTQNLPLQGVARRLVKAGVPAVIAMQDILQFSSAQIFSEYFYHQLLCHGEVDRAVNVARQELYRFGNTESGLEPQARVGKDQWGVPVLFMGMPDGKLFDIAVDEIGDEIPDPDPDVQVLDAASVSDLSYLSQNLATQLSTIAGLPITIEPSSVVIRVEDHQAIQVQKEHTASSVDSDPRTPLSLPLNLPRNQLKTSLSLRPSVIAQTIAAINAGKHIILTGPPGTGKTTLARELSELAAKPSVNGTYGHVMATATADWTTFDTIGGYVPDENGRLMFRPGILLDAIHAGKWLIIDEINRADIDKAFGEIFTVLSGQSTTLPYRIDSRAVRIMAPGDETSLTSEIYNYQIHPNWRIIGTMNVYDKASLFSMSYAFMRRFAFIEVAVPDHRQYTALIQELLEQCKLSHNSNRQIVEQFSALFDTNFDTNHIMRKRAFGPAIVLDMIHYLDQRVPRPQKGAADDEVRNLTIKHVLEAVKIYMVPQLEGLEQDDIILIYNQLRRHFRMDSESEASNDSADVAMKDLLDAIKALFPYIRNWSEQYD